MMRHETDVSARVRRWNELEKMLQDHRRELVRNVQGKIHDARTDSTKESDVFDEGESSTVDVQAEMEFALIQMNADTLKRIDAALRSLADGTYGQCFECGGEIAEARLRALPFAVRCKDCEEARETADLRERIKTQRWGSSALFLDMAN